MAPRNCEIKKIEKTSNRNATFSKRRGGLMKKAHDLSILCDAEIGVIVFSEAENLYQFASSSMNQVLTRYNKSLEASAPENEAELSNSGDMALLKEEIGQLKQNQMQLLGKDLGLNELDELEKLLTHGLVSVKERKEQLLMYQLQQSKNKEEQVMLENATLKKQIAELRSRFPNGEQPGPSSREPKNFLQTQGVSGRNIVSISGAEYRDIIKKSQGTIPCSAQGESTRAENC